MTYLLPTSVESALEALADGKSTILAGATDYYPSQVGGAVRSDDVVDITALNGLRGISRHGEVWRIGALTSWAELVQSDLPAAFGGLQAAAGQVGGVQIQNVASIGGNLCNASPAADGVPPLLTLEVDVELQSARGARVVPVHEFVLGNRVTARRPDELMTALVVPNPTVDSIGSFEKLGARAYLVISIVMVAVLAEIDSEGVIRSARIAVGACSPVAQRLADLERDLVGASVDQPVTEIITPEHLNPLSPIDDVRSSAEYRLAVTPELISRALQSCSRTRP